MNTLLKISDVEGFINESIATINQTKNFKVHDLSITEKVKPLKSFLAHLLTSSKLPPKGTTTEMRLSKTRVGPLALKIKNSLDKSSSISQKLHRLTMNHSKSEIPNNFHFKHSPKITKTPQRRRLINPQLSTSFSINNTEHPIHGPTHLKR